MLTGVTAKSQGAAHIINFYRLFPPREDVQIFMMSLFSESLIELGHNFPLVLSYTTSILLNPVLRFILAHSHSNTHWFKGSTHISNSWHKRSIACTSSGGCSPSSNHPPFLLSRYWVAAGVSVSEHLLPLDQLSRCVKSCPTLWGWSCCLCCYLGKYFLFLHTFFSNFAAVQSCFFWKKTTICSIYIYTSC
jgi:hypothetical protein